MSKAINFAGSKEENNKSKPIPFIGRKNELEEINKVIEDSEQSHIFCVYGPGGIGKTRLLQEIQRTYLDEENSVIRKRIERKDIMIALLQEFNDDEWSQAFTTGVRKMAQKLGVNLKEFDAGQKIEQMKESLEEVIALSPDALIIRKGTNEKLRPLIEQAVRRKINVLAFDNLLQDLPGLTTRVIHEEEEGMRQSLEQLAQEMNFQGNVVITGVNYTTVHERRKKYLEDTLQREYPDISVTNFCVRQRQTGENERETIAEIRNFLKDSPDVKAFWVTWNKVARCVVQALVESGRADVNVYSFDFSSEDIHAFSREDSPWKSTVTTDPAESGASILRLATHAAYGKTLKHQYRLLSRLLTQSDILQHTDDEAYLYGEKNVQKIGWTDLIRSLYAQKLYSEKYIAPISDMIDFDDPNLLNPVNMGTALAKRFNAKENFESFFQAQADYRKMQEAGVAQERLREEEKHLNKKFTECVNRISKQKRLVLFFDTTERLQEAENVWCDLRKKLQGLENVVVFLAGRDAQTRAQQLQSSLFPYRVKRINLFPLSKDECRTYLRQKQKQRSLKLGAELEEKLLILAQGKPILLDLAVEWREDGISLQWVLDEQIDQWKGLPLERWGQFEKHLLKRFRNIRSTLDELILLTAYIFPMNAGMIAELYPKEDAQELFKQVLEYVFVKRLPNDCFKLHDEMDRMLLLHIWPDIDPDGGRRKWYSERIAPYFKQEVVALVRQIEEQREHLTRLEKTAQKTEILTLSLALNENEENLWYFKEQEFTHTLCFDLESAITIFDGLFQQATKSLKFDLRKRIFEKVEKRYDELSPKQEAVVEIHQLQLLFDDGNYQDVETRCADILNNSVLSVKQQIDVYLKRANARVRSGKLLISIHDFKKAKKISEQENLPVWLIKTTNALGWVYRLRGDLPKAQAAYLEARRLCLQPEHGPKNASIRDDYGWILNNLAFVYSNRNKTRETAIGMAQSAIEHWKDIGNEFGLAAGYSMLGIAYYRNDKPEPAFEAFYQAEKYFDSIHNNEWLGSVAVWRGSLFRIVKRLDEAERDLQNALKIGAENIKAMTYCRLGRLYMSRQDWPTAIDYLQKSIKNARETPDYLYWLVSIARLIVIAAEKKEFDHFAEFQKQLDDFVELLKQREMQPDQNNLGIAQIALARLALGQNDKEKIETIVGLLKEGISAVTEYGSYANRDGLSRLKIIEREFDNIAPDIIRAVGQELVKFVIEKESENIAYSAVTQIMYTWANWSGGENADEK